MNFGRKFKTTNTWFPAMSRREKDDDDNNDDGDERERAERTEKDRV